MGGAFNDMQLYAKATPCFSWDKADNRFSYTRKMAFASIRTVLVEKLMAGAIFYVGLGNRGCLPPCIVFGIVQAFSRLFSFMCLPNEYWSYTEVAIV